MSRTASSRQRSQPKPDPEPISAYAVTFAVAIALGAVAFVVMPAFATLRSALTGEMVLRGLVTGGIVGLMGRRLRGVVEAAALGTAAAAIGTLILWLSPIAPDAVSSLVAMLLAAAAAATVFLLVVRGLERIAVAVVFLVVAFSLLWTAGVLGGPYEKHLPPQVQLMRKVPQTKQYAFDGLMLLRIPFLMREGIPYYAAFTKAYSEDARGMGLPPGKLNYREPTLFWIWEVLPVSSPEGIRRWFLAFAIVVMASGYLLSRRFVSSAASMLAPVALMTYFTYAALTGWFGIVEFWAGGLAVITVAALARRRWLLGALLLLLAVAVRELMVYLIPAFVAAWIVYPRRRDEIPALLIALVGPPVVLAAHLAAAPHAVSGSGFDLAPWMHAVFARLIAALQFGSEPFPFGKAVLVLAPIVALVGTLLVPKMWHKVLLLTVLAVPLIALWRFSLNEWGYYWGAILTPLVLALVPTALVLLVPSRLVAAEKTPRAVSSSDAKVRVVLPVRQAATWVGESVRAIATTLAQAGRPFTITVIDDGSTDGTAKAARAADLGDALTVRSEKSSRGWDRSLLTGLRAAASASKPGDVVALVDGTRACDPSELTSLLSAHQAGAGVVLGSRFVLGAKRRGCSLAEKVRALAERSLLHALLPAEGVRDYDAPMRLWDGAELSRLLADLPGDTASLSADVLLAGGARYTAVVDEVPVCCECREGTENGWSRTGLREKLRTVGRVWLADWGVATRGRAQAQARPRGKR